MKLTRRNTLIGLGTIAAGAGVISGTGAFDSVEADRSFEVSVSGDAGALLGLEATNDTIAGTQEGGAGDNDVIYFEISSSETTRYASINENATTEFFDAFSVTNNGSETVDLSIELPNTVNGLSFIVADTRSDNNPLDLVGGSYELTSGESISVDLGIDTTSGGYDDSGAPYQITIRAQTAAAAQA